MDKKTEALKLALEALEAVHIHGDLACVVTPDGEVFMRPAITAIKDTLSRLKSAEQYEIDWKDQYEKQKRRADMWVAKYEADIGPLEKAGPVAAQQQEPVAWRHDMGEENGGWEYFEEASCHECQPLYTSSPPRHPWVGLTDEEQQELYDAWIKIGDGWGSFYALIEVKLKEKNT